VYYLSEQVEEDKGADEETASELSGFSSGTNPASFSYLNSILSELISAANRRESIEVANKVADSIGEKLFIRNRGVKRAKFIVLKGTRMPAILIELGFISNRFEEKNFKNSYYRKMIVDAICDGITEFKNKYEEASFN
jgi:N-acetylmuramoyl-L-alanine amidase